jgi:hypothetical protein
MVKVEWSIGYHCHNPPTELDLLPKSLPRNGTQMFLQVFGGGE